MNKIILTLLLFIYGVNIYSQSWTQLADFAGTQRDDGIAFTINNKAYCLSGLEVGWQCTGNGFIFDGSSETWSPMASLPNGKERQYATGFSYNNTGYMLGGLNCSGVCLKDFWQYSTPTNSWTPLPDFPGQGRQGMSNFMIKNNVYVVGGRLTDGTTLNEVWEYNLTTTTWTQKNNLPVSGLWRGGAFAIDTIGYVCYGINYTNSFNHFIYQYDYTTDTWFVVLNIILPARNYIGCAVANKKVCLYGGQDSLNIITNDLKVFDPANASLTTYGGIPTIGRKGTMAFSLNDVFYITTGLDATQTRIKETWKNTDFVDVKEIKSSFNFQIYPNPSIDKLFVHSNSILIGNVQLYNQLGELFFEARADNYTVEINTGSFTNGIYYLAIKSNQGLSTHKIVINH
jgi:N-acetylneuraminic acid mutarotase